jgi:hypothetical protein
MCGVPAPGRESASGVGRRGYRSTSGRTSTAPPFALPARVILDPIALGRDYLIWAEPRAKALVGLDENFVPIYAREALHADWQNDHEGLPLHYLFDAIPVSGSD